MTNILQNEYMISTSPNLIYIQGSLSDELNVTVDELLIGEFF
jgi:hypothetical protein